MKSTSIRTKVLAALSLCLLAAVGGTIALMRYSFEKNAQVLSAESVSESQKLFEILRAREISKMTAVGAALAANRELLAVYESKDREKLLKYGEPMYTQLKGQGITNWVFHTREPEMAVFLRVHNPAKYGDQLNRSLTKKVVQSHGVESGNELARAGFAVRVIRPLYDSRGEVTGYLELGEELGQFIQAMKAQTGDDYGLLLGKKYLDRGLWADSSASWKRRDNWNDNADFVIADQTSSTGNLIQFSGQLGAIPKDGETLERFQSGKSMFVRRMFPIQDASGNTVGAMFVVRDISGFYWSMRNTQTMLVILTVLALALSTILILTMLGGLVFRRLDNIIAVATRVVGGDYQTEIHPSSEDEIGQFEKLFEQFRRVFVDVLHQVPELQEK